MTKVHLYQPTRQPDRREIRAKTRMLGDCLREIHAPLLKEGMPEQFQILLEQADSTKNID